MKTVKKVLTLLLILTIISQIFIPSNVKAQNTIRTYDSNSLYDEVAKNAVLDNKRSEYVASDTGIDFTKGASSTNGQGVYTIASTKDDLYPIHYYRGNIDNNNVLFGGFCWQIVRTTETGGVKLIYNGAPDENGKCENTEYDNEFEIETSSSNEQYMYDFDLYNNSQSFYYNNLIKVLFNTNWGGDGTIYTSSTSFYYSDKIEYNEDTKEYKLIDYKEYNAGENMADITKKLMGSNNFDVNNPVYTCGNQKEKCSAIYLLTGYNYYTSYGYKELYYVVLYNGETLEKIINKKIKFGNDVEYKDGMYKLVNTIDVPILSISDNLDKILNGHHYYCEDYSNNCSNVNFIYRYNDSIDEYSFITSLILNNGHTIDEFIIDYENLKNNNNSTIKKTIDNWYESSMIENTRYLEDTVWCNDRSRIFNVFDKDSNLENGNQKLSMSLNCSNKVDRFTVDDNNGNGNLTYPTATLTAQEAIYAGNSVLEDDDIRLAEYSPSNYLDRYNTYTMTPYGHKDGKFEQYVIKEGELTFSTLGSNCRLQSINSNIMPIESSCERYYEYSVRPMVSLKHSMVVSSGDGSPTNPYEVVEGNTVEYVIDGDMPNGFLPPEVESYLKGSKVKMNGLKAGDIINGYRFLGWQTKDVEVVDGTFDMPENKVVFVGRFEKIEDSPLTYDLIGKYLTTGIIGVVGLAGFIIIKKKMLN